MPDKYLFKVRNDSAANTGTNLRAAAAPDLSPLGNGVIDVVQNFPWTNTSQIARTDVPKVILKEYNVTRSSLFQQARYLLTATPDVVGALELVSKELGTKGSLIVGAVAGLGAAGPGKRLPGAIVGAAAAGAINAGLATKLANGLMNLPGAKSLTIQGNAALKDYLQPYNGLYATIPTGFQYILPYFSEEWKVGGEDWGDLNGESYNRFDAALQDMSQFYRDGGVGGFTGAGALRSFFPAAYIESPKAFRYGDGSRDVKTIRFSLFNTTSFEDVIRNWQFCFLLMYQNRPNRASRVLVDVPAIYEINIPGIYYCPFCYINGIRIGQIGATREMRMPIQTTSSTDFQPRTVQTANGAQQVSVRPVGEKKESIEIAELPTIIPDAYQIEISITPLVAETKNTMYHTLTQNDSVYDVSIKTPIIGTGGRA